VFVYSLIVSILVWLTTGWKRLTSRRGDHGMVELEQRLALRIPAALPPGRGILIHAVSVGEMAEAEILIRSLLAARTNIEMVVTTGNRDGLARAEQISTRTGATVSVCLLPWDRREAMQRWLRLINPSAVVTLESEIWPNLFLACRDLGIPVLIVNGRIYSGDLGRYRLAGRFFRHVLSCATWIGVQNPLEQERFTRIGADSGSVHVTGDLKMCPPQVVHHSDDPRLGLIRELYVPIITAGSTHPREEELILTSFITLKRTYPGLRLILAPRDVRRAARVSRLCLGRHFRPVLWSDGPSLEHQWDVMVIDEVGWLSSVYPLSTIAIIGGTFSNHGGHNFAEAAVHGCAIVAGHSLSNFREMADAFTGAGACLLTSASGLTDALRNLIANDQERRRIGRAGQEVVLRHSGSADRYAAAVLSHLSAILPEESGNNGIKSIIHEAPLPRTG